jgi:hypothetical protein
MEIRVSEFEAQVLRSLLSNTLGELSMEIADTDNPAFRRELLKRREALSSIRIKLAPVPAEGVLR